MKKKNNEILNTYLQIADLFGEKAQETLKYSNKGKHPFEIDQMIRRCNEQSRILDVGGGIGVNLICISKMNPNHDLYLIDKFEEYTEKNHMGEPENPMGDAETGLAIMQDRGIRVVKQDFFYNYKLPFKSEFFDLITCFDVIEHFPGHPIKLLEEINRVLKYDGIFILGGPNLGALKNRIKMLIGRHPYMSFDRWVHDKHYYSHFREYNRNEYRKLLEISGFSVTEIIMSPEPIKMLAKYGYLKRRRSLRTKLILSIVVFFERLFPCLRSSVYCISKRTEIGNKTASGVLKEKRGSIL